MSGVIRLTTLGTPLSWRIEVDDRFRKGTPRVL